MTSCVRSRAASSRSCSASCRVSRHSCYSSVHAATRVLCESRIRTLDQGTLAAAVQIECKGQQAPVVRQHKHERQRIAHCRHRAHAGARELEPRKIAHRLPHVRPCRRQVVSQRARDRCALLVPSRQQPRALFRRERGVRLVDARCGRQAEDVHRVRVGCHAQQRRGRIEGEAVDTRAVRTAAELVLQAPHGDRKHAHDCAFFACGRQQRPTRIQRNARETRAVGLHDACDAQREQVVQDDVATGTGRLGAGPRRSVCEEARLGRWRERTEAVWMVDRVQQLHIANVVHVQRLRQHNDQAPAVQAHGVDRRREHELTDGRLPLGIQDLQTPPLGARGVDHRHHGDQARVKEHLHHCRGYGRWRECRDIPLAYTNWYGSQFVIE